MAREFVIVAFDDQINGVTEVFSAQEHNETFGRADSVVVYVRGTNNSGTSPTLTLKLYGSNDNKYFTAQSTLLNAVSLGLNAPYESIVDTGSAQLAAYLRFGATLGGTTPGTNLKVIVCGRSS